LKSVSKNEGQNTSTNLFSTNGEDGQYGRVVHCKKEPYDIYIGRGSIWGNPYVIGKDGSRHDVIEKYRNWLVFDAGHLHSKLKELKGKTLACWCSPKACHGDVLIKILDNMSDK